MLAGPQEVQELYLFQNAYRLTTHICLTHLLSGRHLVVGGVAVRHSVVVTGGAHCIDSPPVRYGIHTQWVSYRERSVCNSTSAARIRRMHRITIYILPPATTALSYNFSPSPCKIPHI